MHGPDIYAWEARRPGKHLQWLRAFSGPVYMHQELDHIPTSVAYPLKEIAGFLGEWVWRIGEKDGEQDTRREPYLSSSIAYEIALAIHEGFA